MPQGPRRQRRRRRAVWRPGEGISRTVESDAPEPDAPEPATQEPVTQEPVTQEPVTQEPDAPERDAAPRPTPPRPPAESAPPAKPEAAKPEGKRRARNDPTERGLRELVGAGSSQLGPVRAMRARDANRPTEADLAQAEEEIVLVRRHWKPPKNG